MIMMIMIREVETAKEGRLGLARELRRQLVAGEQVRFCCQATWYLEMEMKNMTLQAELVGCGEGRKLSCLSPIGESITEMLSIETKQPFFFLLCHQSLMFGDSILMAVAKSSSE